MVEPEARTPETASMADDRSDNPRRFAVSANRGSARHRMRYVETGGASVDTGECNFCQALPEPDHD